MPDLGEPAALTVLTGAGGWFGRAWLRAHAAPQHRHGPVPTGRVRALAGSPGEVTGILEACPGAEVHVGDVVDPEVLQTLFAGAEGAVVVHAAGVIHPRRVDEFARVNVGGTRAVLEQARSAGVRRLVHVSSNSAFGVNPTPTDRFRHEEPFRPYLGYGASKAAAEAEVRAAHDPGTLETVVVRPPWFYGPWQPVRQTTFFTMVAAGRFPVMGSGAQQRSMVHVDNLVQGAALAARVSDVGGDAFWVADARPYPMAEIVRTVAEVLADEGYLVARSRLPGAVPGGRRVPALVARGAERLDRLLQSRGRYQQELHVLGEMDKTIACDIAYTRERLGYEPEVELREGMREAVRWCRQRGIALAPRADGAR
ncbi:NAD-dependent epimerase/dehydratase family protein [Nocardioides pocheonensis]|uniref:NAD(P)-dependent oxidoreductase n=1 Tax=Nocardioides pocheonensis TaxID=661485 RepID=A0A3N0GU91_9ACTN|nr:NAD(P)-dependent oxidoreductase [Nocardioides pocheonensis]RNM16025.1 NAD(P)-dependent oxidoreductase [Nocardioides pocheonensis]